MTPFACSIAIKLCGLSHRRQEKSRNGKHTSQSLDKPILHVFRYIRIYHGSRQLNIPSWPQYFHPLPSATFAQRERARARERERERLGDVASRHKYTNIPIWIMVLYHVACSCTLRWSEQVLSCLIISIHAVQIRLL